jgi:ankyrin repeat protein
VVRIDLNDHTDALKALKQEQIDKEKAIEFVSEKVLKLKPGLDLELFKQCCEQKQKVRIVIMLDGFDEISPIYKDTVIDLLQALRQTAAEQLWVTTRPHLREELEDKLQQLSYTLEPFSEENQVEFLTKFWSLKDWFTEPNDKEEEIGKSKLEIYAKTLIKKLSVSIKDKDRQFTGIPLQTRMLAEAFDKDVKIFYVSAESISELPFKLDLLELYERFIERKYEIYQEEKLQVSVNNPAAKEQRKRHLKSIREDHQLLALKVLCTEEQVAQIQNNRECVFSTEQLTRIGIVQVSDDGKPHFIHRTFAEYYVADFLVNRLTDGNNTSEQVQTFILKDIFLKEDYRVVRVFVDGLLSMCMPPDEVLKQYGNGISDLLTVSEMVLNQAAREGNANIIGFLLNSLQEADHRDSLIQLLLAKDNERKTAWHLAVFWGNMEALQKLWECANENLTREELKNKYVSAQDSGKKTAWHVAAEEGNLKILQQLWEWAKEKLTDEELNNNLLLANDSRGKIAWHMAAKSGNTEVLEKIWKYAEDRLTPEELKNKLLLATDKLRQTAWHYATWEGNINLLQTLWELAKEKLTAQDLSNKLLLAKVKRGQTAWHVAAERGNLELLERIWDWATLIQTPEDLNSKLMLETDNRERTVWHLAAECGKLKLLEKLWEWAKEVLTAEEIKENLLLAGDDNEQTFLHVAAKRTTTTELEQLWDWATQNLTQEEIRKLLLAEDDHEDTVLNLVAKRRNTEVLEKMRDWAKEFLTPEEQRNVFGQRR